MARITDAINRSWTYSDFLVNAMVDEFKRGFNERSDRYARHAAIVKALRRILQFFNLNGSDTDFDNTEIEDVIAKIEEFSYSLYLDIDEFSAQAGDDSDALGGGAPVVVAGTLPTPRSFTFTVSTDGQTVFTMPFDVSELYDIDSVSLVLNDADPILGTNYTLSGNTLTWTGDYPLSAGWIFEIKYWI